MEASTSSAASGSGAEVQVLGRWSLSRPLETSNHSLILLLNVVFVVVNDVHMHVPSNVYETLRLVNDRT